MKLTSLSIWEMACWARSWKEAILDGNGVGDGEMQKGSWNGMERDGRVEVSRESWGGPCWVT